MFCDNEEKPCEDCHSECKWFETDLFKWIDELWQEETYGKSLGG